ncbi:hypothetical protein [Brevundimonas sp. Root1423]|uniref:hypothetical protein n=1 Tax=Brevundimonas sp. Root1423 TaxID=1736462 RepID=UPI000AFB9C99|nr:hypothetical protein [Brevundimonas sp. Root1423]
MPRDAEVVGHLGQASVTADDQTPGTVQLGKAGDDIADLGMADIGSDRRFPSTIEQGLQQLACGHHRSIDRVFRCVNLARNPRPNM